VQPRVLIHQSIRQQPIGTDFYADFAVQFSVIMLFSFVSIGIAVHHAQINAILGKSAVQCRKEPDPVMSDGGLDYDDFLHLILHSAGG
jgi:hypothetical protein